MVKVSTEAEAVEVLRKWIRTLEGWKNVSPTGEGVEFKENGEDGKYYEFAFSKPRGTVRVYEDGKIVEGSPVGPFTTPWSCMCEAGCDKRLRIPKKTDERMDANWSLYIIEESCPNGPTKGDPLVEQRDGYAIYQDVS